MPAAQFEYDNFVAGAVNSPNATEGIICTTRTVSSAYAGSSFAVHFSGLWTSGAGTTTVTFRIRRDGATGTLVASWPGIVIAAAGVQVVSFDSVDNLTGEVAGQLWVLTAQQAGGTGAGNLANGFSSVTVPV